MELMGDRGWRRPGVEPAVSFWRRWRGSMVTAPSALLLAGASVHGFWMRSEVWAVGIEEDGRVRQVRRLRGRRIVWIPGARWILELPIDETPPQPGEILTCVVSTGEADRHARPSPPLRHSHRQPRRRFPSSRRDPG